MVDRLRARGDPETVTIHACALGRQAEQRELINYARPELSSFLPLDETAENPFRDTAVVGTEPVAIRTVDDFVRDAGIETIDLLKIDTQGFDADVLAGAAATLAAGRVRAALIELNFIAMYRGQSDPDEVARTLAEAGLLLVDYYEKVRHGHTLAWCTALFARRAPGPPPWSHPNLS
jgi:FkbM family methyltransferase